MKRESFIPIIGLEIHVQLKTKSKMFCGCSASWFGKEPNTLVCPVCLGLPGALPVPDKKAIEWTIMLGLALNCQINKESKFDRKNYFYPDLPKGYQISQYDQPLAMKGWLNIKWARQGRATTNASDHKGRNYKKIRISRVHLEEDTGKLIHHNKSYKTNKTYIDFNRSGVPLVEVVTEPDIRSSEEALVFMKKVQELVRWIGISDPDMEKGSMRIEPNVSIWKYTSEESRSLPRHLRGDRMDSSEVNSLPNYKVEIKNINSFKFAKKAIDYEINRQREIFLKGEKVVQETRGWDEKKRITIPQRRKEEAQDYRYFPEPDIPVIKINRLRLTAYGLRLYGLKVKKLKRIFFKRITNINIIKIIKAIKQIRKIRKKGVPRQELARVIAKVIAENPKVVADYKKGKEQAINVLIGKVIKKVGGKGEAGKIREEIEKKI